MVNDRLLNALELFARLLGVATAVAGVGLLPSAPILGVPLVVVGVLLAVRPVIAGELLDMVTSLA